MSPAVWIPITETSLGSGAGLRHGGPNETHLGANPILQEFGPTRTIRRFSATQIFANQEFFTEAQREDLG